MVSSVSCVCCSNWNLLYAYTDGGTPDPRAYKDSDAFSNDICLDRAFVAFGKLYFKKYIAPFLAGISLEKYGKIRI